MYNTTHSKRHISKLRSQYTCDISANAGTSSNERQIHNAGYFYFERRFFTRNQQSLKNTALSRPTKREIPSAACT